MVSKLKLTKVRKLLLVLHISLDRDVHGAIFSNVDMRTIVVLMHIRVDHNRLYYAMILLVVHCIVDIAVFGLLDLNTLDHLGIGLAV